jgi:hypothetical protein
MILSCVGGGLLFWIATNLRGDGQIYAVVFGCVGFLYAGAYIFFMILYMQKNHGSETRALLQL